MENFEIVGGPYPWILGKQRESVNVTFKYKGLLGDCMVLNWGQNNMSVIELRMINSYTRSEFKEIVDAIFDHVENDIEDLRNQDHESDADIQEKEEHQVNSSEE